MKKMKFTKVLRLRITKKEKEELKVIALTMGFKNLSTFIRFIIREEAARILVDEDLFNAYVKEAHEGTLLLAP
jgi:uncharacterized protein (DUF1778 family)